VWTDGGGIASEVVEGGIRGGIMGIRSKEQIRKLEVISSLAVLTILLVETN
jgi:hypothetical protein